MVTILAGRMTLDVRLRGLDLCSDFGSFSDWEPEDLKSAIASLLAEGEIRAHRRGPWKHRLTA